MTNSSLIKTVSTAAAAVSAALAILLSAHGCSDENGISSAFLKQRKENAASVTDSDGKKYRTVKIGNVTWMAENLNRKTDASACYDNKEANCAKYGRLYTWEDAVMNACPSGWRLPDNGEWENLKHAVGDALLLKDKSWNGGEDKYGWSALPGGYRTVVNGAFNALNTSARWWSFSENMESVNTYSYSTRAYDWRIGGDAKDSLARNSESKNYAMESVRCVDGAGLATRYYVLFDANGGEFSYMTFNLLVTTEGGLPLEDKFPAKDPGKTGDFAFAGWFDENETQYYKYTHITKNTTLKASWVVKTSKITITFNTDGGTPENVVTKDGVAGNTLEADSGRTADYENGAWLWVTPPTKPGTVFTGWFDANGTQYNTQTVFHKDVTLTARYRDCPTYAVAFDANGGTSVASPIMVDSGKTLGVLPATSKSGYRFAGWYDAAGTRYTEQTVIHTAVTLTADFREEGGGSYEGVRLGGNYWMTKNLNVETADSWCYGEGADAYVNDEFKTLTPAEIQANCDTYGRLYTWAAAKTACESVGWKLPDTADWRRLVEAAGGQSAAGTKLKSASGWDGTDDYGFNALPGGKRSLSFGGLFSGIGSSGEWWTATGWSGNGYTRDMSRVYAGVSESSTTDKRAAVSVRCVEK